MADLSFDVDPDGTGDYLSLSAFDSAQQQDLTDGGGDTMTAECMSSSGTADTTVATIAGWDTAAPNYLSLEAKAGHQHAGVWNTSKYRIEADAVGQGTLDIGELFVRVNGLQVKHTDGSPSGNDAAYLVYVSSGAGDVRISNCIAWQGRYPFRIYTPGVTMWNSVGYGGTDGGIVNISAGITNIIYNSTILGGTNGIYEYAGTFNLYNTYGYGSGTGANSISGVADHVAVSDATQAQFTWANITQIATGDATGTTANKLVDSGATFITDKVYVGMRVLNVDDTTYANVTALDSETVLSLSADIFESGEEYDIRALYCGIDHSTSAGAYFTNITGGSEDYHIQSSSLLIGKGTDNPGSGLYSTDIDGDTWTSPWGIGIDKYMAVGGVAPTGVIFGPLAGPFEGVV